MKAILKGARRAGPYLLVELLLPGGSVIAALMFALRNPAVAAKLAPQLIAVMSLAILAVPAL